MKYAVRLNSKRIQLLKPREGEIEVVKKFKTKNKTNTHTQNKTKGWDWRDGSGVKSIACSSKVLSSISSNHMVAHNHP